MSAVLKALLEVTISSVILYCAILLFRKLFSGKLSAVFQYGIWFLLLLRLLVPITLEGGLRLPAIPAQLSFLTADTAAASSGSVNHPTATGGQTAISGPQTASGGMIYLKTPMGNTGAPALPPSAAIEPAASPAVLPANRETSPALHWDIDTILICLWLFGIAANAACFAAGRLRLSAQLRKGRMDVPAAVWHIAEECRASLGLTTQFRISMLHTIKTPALAVALRPMLLIPQGADKLYNEKQLRCSMLHEMMHWKRRDPLLCIFLNVLRCVYWFNPVVWFAARQIRMDMETACDAAVVRRMDAGQKREYAGVIVSMFACGGRAAEMTLGMAMENNRVMAERRIRGVFMRGRTHGGVRALAAVLSAALLLACFTTGCGPSPSGTYAPPSVSATSAPPAQPTGSAGSAALPTMASPSPSQAATQATASPAPTAAPIAKFPAPDTCAESFMTKDGKVLVNVDATVLVPDTDQFPVVSVEPTDLSIDFVKKAIAVLMEGQPVYEPRFILTKQEINDDIKRLNSFIANPKSSDYDSLLSGDPDTVKMGIGMMKEYIRADKQKLRRAEDTYTPKLAQIAFQSTIAYEKKIYGSSLSRKNDTTVIVDAVLPDGNSARINAENRLENLYRSTCLEFNKSKEFNGILDPDPYPVEKKLQLPILTMRTGDAIALAAQALQGMGLDDMRLTSLNLRSDNAIQLGESVLQGLSEGKSYTPQEILDNSTAWNFLGHPSAAGSKPWYYILSFTQAYNGVPNTPNSSYLAAASDNNTAVAYSPESVTMYIDGRGITNFSYSNPLRTDGLVASNAKLLSFQQVLDVFKKQVADRYGLSKLQRRTDPANDDKEFLKKLDKGYIDITSITLGMLRTPDKDHPGRYLMIPVWNFFGADTVKLKNDKSSDADTLTALANGRLRGFGGVRSISYITISAIDGSVVTDID